MAPGVTKTYRKRYRQNLERAIELLTDTENPESFSKDLADKAEEISGTIPKLENQTPEYKEAELKLLAEAFGDKIAGKIQRFAFKLA
jgi:ribonucleoside-triphosphate reductase